MLLKFRFVLPARPEIRESATFAITVDFVRGKGDPMILKVKKPDFLGNSMWEFNHEGHPISASILDQGWLADFREHGLGVRPGVALRALVRVEASYDDDSEALPARYAVLKVYEVIPPKPPSEQLYLPTPSS